MTDVPLVMLPGSMCDHRLFERQMTALGAGVIFGDLTQHDSIEGMAEHVLTASPDRFAVAGLSLGGIVAAEIAAQAPERLLGVAVMDTNLAPPDRNQLDNRTSWAQDVRAGHFIDFVADQLVTPMTCRPDLHGSLIFDMARDLGPSVFLQQNEALLHRRDRRDDLASLSVPILVACGHEDRLCPPRIHHELATNITGAELVIVKDAGHLATIDQPGDLNTVLTNWLTKCANTTITTKGSYQ